MIINNFKKLIEENKSMLNELTLGLFEDSIRCFDAGIYRQAYLLALRNISEILCLMQRCQRVTSRTNGMVFRQN